MAAVVAVVLCLGGPNAQAAHFEGVAEVAAQDGVGAAVEWSKLAFPDGSEKALLGRADLFADSLASGGLQVAQPLLLTASASLSPATAAELERLNVQTVTILGGRSAVSDEVGEELRRRGYRVRRFSGPTRIETAIVAAQSGSGSRTALLARAFGGSDPTAAFADALAAGAWAAETGWPVLLTETDRLSQPTATYLSDRTDQVWVIGGAGAVSEAALAQARALGVSVQRVSGPTRFETATAIARQRGYASAADAQQVVLVDGQRGDAWSDGFAAAAYAGRTKAPIVLANSAAGTLPDPTAAFLKAGPAARLTSGWTVPAAQVDQAAREMGKQAAITRVMQVRMTGRNVVRPADSRASEPLWGHGEEGGTGLLALTIDEQAGTIAYTYEAQLDSRPTDSNALVLRRGGVAERGPVVVRFPEPSREHTGSGEVSADDFEGEFAVAELLAAPAAFYAEAATRDDEEGAIRGQLPSGGEAHLPVKPELLRIESKGGDDWVVLHFASPVYAIEGVVTGLTVTVEDGKAAQIQNIDAALTPLTARTTVTVDLDRNAVAGKTTAVQLSAGAASALRSNLGERPSAVTRTEATPTDSTPPVFESIQAIEGSNVVTAVFSEPVHTETGSVKDVRDDVTVTAVAGGTTTTFAVLDGADVARADRSTRWDLELDGRVPAGAEMRVTLSGPSTTADTAAADTRDAAGNKLASAVLTRSAATRGGAGTFTDVRIGNLVVGGGRFEPARNQDQVITAKVASPLPGTADLVLIPPVQEDPAAAYTGTSYRRARGELTWTGAREPVVDEDVSDLKIDLPDDVLIPDGGTIRVMLKDVVVTRATPTTATPLEFRIRRTDTNGTAVGTFHVLNGVEVLSPGVLPAALVEGETRTHTQQLILKMRSQLNANKRVVIDLRELADLGVDYDDAIVTSSVNVLTHTLTGGVLTASWSGAIANGGEVTLSIAGVQVPHADAMNVPVTISRPDDAGTAVTVQHHHVLTRAATATPTASPPTWQATAEMTLTFPLHGTLPQNQKVEFDFSHAMFTAVSTITLKAPAPANWSVAGKKVVYTAPSGGATGTLTAIVQVDTRLSGKQFPLHVRRADEPLLRWTLVVNVPNGDVTIGDVPLAQVTYSGSASFGSAQNDKFTLTFTGPITALAGGNIVLRRVDGGQETDAPTVRCGSSVVCDWGSTDRKVVTMTYTGTSPSSSQVASPAGRQVKSVGGFMAMGTGTVSSWSKAAVAPSATTPAGSGAEALLTVGAAAKNASVPPP